jgi:Putative Ig domain
MRLKLAFLSAGKKRKPIAKFVLPLASLVACTCFWVGCSSFSQTSVLSSNSSPQHIVLQSSLPGATVGAAYNSILSVTGGHAPYGFSVQRGELPLGLALNSGTGRISGTPTKAGNFAFTIMALSQNGSRMVLGQPAGMYGAHNYIITVSPCVPCLTVQVAPTNPSVIAGEKIQFSAFVSNTSNTAVVWSASAGTISANGLFTAPRNGKSAVVTATSAAESSVKSSATVTITSLARLAIDTITIPSAVVAAPYSATLDASGGQPPYTWAIVSGSLPPGVKLNARTGIISGSPSQAGSFAFTARGSDAASQIAQQNLSLLVSNSGGNCGPPAYNCSRSDLKIAQLPQTPPNVGNLTGANTIVTDPDFHSRIVRVTDAHTNPDATFVNRTFVSAGSGSADDNLWNVDSTMFVVQDTGSNTYPFSFNPATLQASRMYVSNFPSTNGLMIASSGIWSRVNPNLLYTLTKTAIHKYDFTDRSNPPSAQTIYDFTSSANCLPAHFRPTWSVNGGVSGDDTVFGRAFSNTGGQGTGIYVVVYKVGSGCSILNTQTGQVSGEWGDKGTINIADRWTIHNVKLSKDGNWMIITPTQCTSASCSPGPYFWQVGTTNVGSCGQGGLCSGHFTEGHSHWVNCNNSPMANSVIRSFSEPTSAHSIGLNLPQGIIVPLDQHQSWNNVDPQDSLPFFSSTWSNLSPFPAAWYNEIIAVAPDGSKTWRFAHTFITARSRRFSTAYAIGTISQDGRFFIFSSDWMGKLGSESGAASCIIGKDCRGDVFVVELK